MKILANEVSNLSTSNGKNIDDNQYFSKINKPKNTIISFSKVKTKKLVSMEDFSSHKFIEREHAANIIKRSLRKFVAAQSYGNMFATGEHFRELGHHYSIPDKAEKFSFAVLDHLNKISQDYLDKIAKKIDKLTASEEKLAANIRNIKWHFRHQSNADLRESTLNISSNKRMARNEIKGSSHTIDIDREKLSNDDFIFFGVEYSNLEKGLPLNTIHATVDYGANAFILDENHPSIKQGYLTLTDHYYNLVPHASRHEHQEIVNTFPVVSREIFRYVHADKGQPDVPIYTTEHMKKAMALHLIDFIRSSQDHEFRNAVLNNSLNGFELDRLLNFVFQAEFHIPRLLSTTYYKKIFLRPMKREEAIKASNIYELSNMTKNKFEACEALHIAINNAKDDVVVYLLNKWNIIANDLKINRKFIDIEYRLSDMDSSINILSQFLSRELIKPNTLFKKINKGQTMLDNAIRYDKKDMILLLRGYGAKTGEEIRAEN